jgi:hypothetical protein
VITTWSFYTVCRRLKMTHVPHVPDAQASVMCACCAWYAVWRKKFSDLFDHSAAMCILCIGL